jgi:hypothetical protein
VPSAESDERCRLLIGLGTAQRNTGDPVQRETLLDACRIASDLKDVDLAAGPRWPTTAGLPGAAPTEVGRQRIEAIERAIELDEPHPARRARLLALLAQELSWEPEFATAVQQTHRSLSGTS